MSSGHHGGAGNGDLGDDQKRRLDDILKRFVAQGEGTANRAYPEGRTGAHDEGELAFAVGVNDRHGTVEMHFNKPVAWMGMSPEDAVRLAKMLIDKARSVSKGPLVVTV